MASLRALKVPVYSLCQQRSHRAQPRHTFSAARSNTMAGFSSVDCGAFRPILSYKSRSAPAALFKRSFSCAPVDETVFSARLIRFPPKIRPGSIKNKIIPKAASKSSGWAKGSLAGNSTATDAAKKAPAAPLRRHPCRLPVSSPAKPRPAVKMPLPLPVHKSVVKPSPNPADTPTMLPRS